MMFIRLLGTASPTPVPAVMPVAVPVEVPTGGIGVELGVPAGKLRVLLFSAFASSSDVVDTSDLLSSSVTRIKSRVLSPSILETQK